MQHQLDLVSRRHLSHRQSLPVFDRQIHTLLRARPRPSRDPYSVVCNQHGAWKSSNCTSRSFIACASARRHSSLRLSSRRHKDVGSLLDLSVYAATGFGGDELPNGDSAGFGGGNGNGKPLPTQGDVLVEGPGESRTAVADRGGDGNGLKSTDLDYLAVRFAVLQYVLSGRERTDD